MAGAYISSTHSLQVGTDAGIRNQSVNYIKQQLELVKLAEQTNISNLASYTDKPNQPFCIDPTSGGKVAADTSGFCTICVDSSQTVQGFADSHGVCLVGEPSTSIALVYDDTTKVFTSTAKWLAPNGSGQDQSVAYYKLAAGTPTAPASGSTLIGDIEVQSNPGLPVQPRLIIYYNSISLPQNKVYDVTYPVGSQKCNDPGPGEYTTPAPPYQFIGGEDILEERCQSYSLNIDLSGISVPVTSLKFDFLNDYEGFEPGHDGDYAYHMDNNIILRSVGVVGKTVTLASYCTFPPGEEPNPPIGSTIPPYSLWILSNHCPATFNVN
jgi:hypothetical protein